MQSFNITLVFGSVGTTTYLAAEVAGLTVLPVKQLNDFLADPASGCAVYEDWSLLNEPMIQPMCVSNDDERKPFRF